MKQLYTIREVCEVLAVCRGTVSKMLRNGILKPTRIGRRVSVSKWQLDRLIDRRTKTEAP